MRKKIDSHLGPLSIWVSSGDSEFLPHLKDAREVNWYVYMSQSESVGMCMSAPCNGRLPVQGGSHLVS